MWGKLLDRSAPSGLKSLWCCAVFLFSLVLSGVIFINYQPSVYSVLQGTNKGLIIWADMAVVIGLGIACYETLNRCSIRKRKKELENAKKVRHELRRHIQNVQALLYIEDYDEVCDYALSLEEELKFI